MKIADFLEREGLTGAALSKALGYNGAEAVNARKRKDEEIPEDWHERLLGLGYRDFGEGLTTYTPPPTDDAEALFRDQEPPAAPDGARIAEPPVQIDYASVAGYISGAYSMAARFAVPDPLLAQVIEDHAEQAGQAWAHYIQSEPRVAALVQRMMIGTPLGEVIGVHVGIVFSYTLARTAARNIAADYARRTAGGDVAAEAEEPGPAFEAPEGDMAAA